MLSDVVSVICKIFREFRHRNAEVVQWPDRFTIRHKGVEYIIPKRTGQDHILDQMYKSRQFYELELLEAINDVISSKGVAIDAGANIGNHSLYFSAVMGMRVVAFEPVQMNRDVLHRLIQLNGDQTQITVQPTALSDREDKVQMILADISNPGMFRIGSGSSACEAATETLDTALRRLGIDPREVGILKIDVEGHEKEVLLGAKELLATAHPLLSVEVVTTEFYHVIREILEPFGYRPIAVYCATPTVLYSCEGQDAGYLVRKRIARFEKGRKR